MLGTEILGQGRRDEPARIIDRQGAWTVHIGVHVTPWSAVGVYDDRSLPSASRA